MRSHIAFIGGGNMASAIIQGLIRQGHAADHIAIVEPFAEARAKLATQFGIHAQADADASLKHAEVVVWAVKPQTFQEAAHQAQAHTRGALHLSVAAGIPSQSIAAWLGSDRVVRAMPNTPALIGRGITALFARQGVQEHDRQQVEQILRNVMPTTQEEITREVVGPAMVLPGDSVILVADDSAVARSGCPAARGWPSRRARSCRLPRWVRGAASSSAPGDRPGAGHAPSLGWPDRRRARR